MTKPAQTDGNGLHILVVDDHEDSVELLSLFLAQAGHRVETATDGDEAIRLITTTRYDAVVLDISIPGPDGYDVARAVTTRWAAAKPLLVALSGYPTDATAQRGREAGFDHFLVKPVDLEQLKGFLAGAGASHSR